jgi:hypothetical protein
MAYLTVSYRSLPRSILISLKAAIATATILGSMSLQPTLAGAPIQDMVATYPSMADSIYSRFSVSTPHSKPVAGGYALAPMPNQDAFAPRVAESKGPEVAPSLLGGKSNSYRGEGFVSGSTPQVTQQPKRMPMPGISLKVPLY